MAGAFCAARSTKRDSHARWLHCLVRLRISLIFNGFRNRWIGFGLAIHGLDGFLFVLLLQAGNSIAWAWTRFGYLILRADGECRTEIRNPIIVLFLRADGENSGTFVSWV